MRMTAHDFFSSSCDILFHKKKNVLVLLGKVVILEYCDRPELPFLSTPVLMCQNIIDL